MDAKDDDALRGASQEKIDAVGRVREADDLARAALHQALRRECFALVAEREIVRSDLPQAGRHVCRLSRDVTQLTLDMAAGPRQRMRSDALDDQRQVRPLL